MRVRVLGCSGAEFPGSNSPAFLLDGEILLDAGSISNVLGDGEQRRIRHIFVTHAHLDHIRGIPFLADNIVLTDQDHRVSVYTIPSVIRTIRRNLFNSAVWPDFTVIPHPDDAILNFRPVRPARPVSLDGYVITPYAVNHTVPAVGYLVEDPGGRRLFYTGDTGPADATWKAIGRKRIHCLVIDVSFPDGMEEMALQTGHLTPRLLKEEIAKIPVPPEAVFVTHPKPQYLNAITKELSAIRLGDLRPLPLRDGDQFRV